MSIFYYGDEGWMKNFEKYDISKIVDIDFCEGFGILTDCNKMHIIIYL